MGQLDGLSGRLLRIPVVDGTKVMTAVHQNHDYIHVMDGTGESWEGPEAQSNRELAGTQSHSFSHIDATWMLTSKGLRPALTIYHIWRYTRTLPILYPWINPVWVLWRKLREVLRIVRGQR